MTPPIEVGMAELGSREPRRTIKNLYRAERFLIKTIRVVNWWDK
jgi:hypothetical protein